MCYNTPKRFFCKVLKSPTGIFGANIHGAKNYIQKFGLGLLGFIISVYVSMCNTTIITHSGPKTPENVENGPKNIGFALVMHQIKKSRMLLLCYCIVMALFDSIESVAFYHLT